MTNVEAMALVKSAPAGASSILARLAEQGEVELTGLNVLDMNILRILSARKNPPVKLYAKVVTVVRKRVVATPAGMSEEVVSVSAERRQFYRFAEVSK